MAADFSKPHLLQGSLGPPGACAPEETAAAALWGGHAAWRTPSPLPGPLDLRFLISTLHLPAVGRARLLLRLKQLLKRGCCRF